MIFNIKGDFDKELLTNFTEVVNQLNFVEDMDLTMYIDSGGGEMDVYRQMVDMVNTLALEKYTINLIGAGDMHSAAFRFFFDCVGSKRVLPSVTAIHHKSRRPILFYEGGYQDHYGKEILKELKSEKKEMNSFNKSIGLTKDEIEMYNNNVDVTFTYKRMLELLQNDVNNLLNQSVKL